MRGPRILQATDMPLFAAANINGLTLSNRLAVAPMTRISASTEGHATEAMVR
jgi:2,4-dienoyl-CoA reductase-like NADH-dependent reductase (Old Yellow Enzyme family)